MQVEALLPGVIGGPFRVARMKVVEGETGGDARILLEQDHFIESGNPYDEELRLLGGFRGYIGLVSYGRGSDSGNSRRSTPFGGYGGSFLRLWGRGGGFGSGFALCGGAGTLSVVPFGVPRHGNDGQVLQNHGGDQTKLDWSICHGFYSNIRGGGWEIAIDINMCNSHRVLVFTA